MNCQEIERDLLLDGAGELPASRRAGLGRHLAACGECRARRDELAQWAPFVRSAVVDTPSDALIARVLAEAAARRPSLTLIHHPRWRAALALAAGLMLLVGVAGLLVQPPSEAPSVAEGASRPLEVSSLLGMLMEQDQNAAAAHAAMAEGDLQGFARQLLIMEGLDVDVAEDSSDELSRLEGRQPTTLRWRSTHGLQSETRV